MPRPGAVLGLLRDALPVAGIALLVQLALGRCVAERYLVPSPSMEPLLHGEPRHGDVVLVDKLADAAAVRAGDVVVLRDPHDPGRQLVKRVAARGDDAAECCLDIRDGDLWRGPDRQHLRRVVKDPAAARALRVSWCEWPLRGDDRIDPWVRLPGGGPAGARLEVPVATATPAVLLERFGQAARTARLSRPEPQLLPEGFFGTTRAVDGGFLDTRGRRNREGNSAAIDDVGMEFTVELPAGLRELLCGLELRPDVFLFRWRLDAGEVELWRNGERLQAWPGTARPGPVQVEYGLLDGRLFFGLDGAITVVERRPEWTTPDPGPVPRPWPRNLLYAGGFADRDGLPPLRLRRLRVFRDLHWQRGPVLGAGGESWPRLVPPGQLFLLGDNTFDSEDSRTRGCFPLADYLGRPVAVIGPWAFRRWL